MKLTKGLGKGREKERLQKQREIGGRRLSVAGSEPQGGPKWVKVMAVKHLTQVSCELATPTLSVGHL
jgi:hypothetical protein